MNCCVPKSNHALTACVRLFLAGVFFGLTAAAHAADVAPVKGQEGSYRTVVEPFMAKYCVSCHDAKKQAGSLTLHDKSAASLEKDRETWESVIQRLQQNEMPPANKPQPTLAEKKAFVSWVNAELLKANCTGEPDPGRVTLRRLNRTEYANTIRDLVGVNYAVNDDFPADDVGYGFDNIGDVLSLSPLLLEKYLAAAERIIDKAFEGELPPIPPTTRWFGRQLLTTSRDELVRERGRAIAEAGEVYVEHTFPEDGEYLLRFRAYGQQVGRDPVRVAVCVDGQDVQKFDVRASEARNGQNREARAQVKAGKRRYAVSFLNPYRDDKQEDPAKRDRTLVVSNFEIHGPLPKVLKLPSAAEQQIMTVRPGNDVTEAEAARRILADFARRAFRRPVHGGDVSRLVRLYESARSGGETFEGGIKLGLQAVLVSPHFLFKVERDRKQGDKAYPIDELELATRLSYFLWSTMPDEELLRLAEQGRLRTELEPQVRRMLKDPRVRALGENFAGQWLQIRNLKTAAPDAKLFPGFDEPLRNAMLQETMLYFEAVVREDRNLFDFIDGDFTFVNERLAKHYSIPNVKGDEFRRVSLHGTGRGGILTHASVLTVTSNPTRTSPVKRGKFILENILNTPPPPPPPDVPELEDEKGAVLIGSLRQRMEQHRKDPNCATCHQRMDTLGFAFENFDAVGAWRAKDGAFAIDPAGTLPDGRSFQDPAELRTILRGDHQLFRRCLAEKLLTFALGRGVEHFDRCAVDSISQTVQNRQDRFSELVLAIVRSEPFQMRTPSTRGAK